MRLSEQEKRIVDMTKKSVYGDGDVPRGVVIERACRALLAEKETEEEGIHL